MKTFNKILFALICLTMLGTTAWGQLLTDDFSYTAGTLLTANGWVAHSGAGTNSHFVVYPGLTYAGHAGSGIGGADTLRTSGEDVNSYYTAPGTGISTGTAYYSFIVKLDTAQTTGDYFAHVITGTRTTTTTFSARVWAKRDASDATKFAFGISKSSTAANIAYTATTAYTLGTTYFVTVKYIFMTGLANDSVKLFINPVPGGTEPTPTLSNSALDIAATDIAFIDGVAIRQGTAGSMPRGKIDAFRLGTTWASVTPAPATSSSSDIIANVSFTYPTNIDYASNTGTNVTSSNPEVFELDIRDGGASSPDGDGFSTTLTAITLSVTNSSVLEKVALYDGTSELGEVTASGSITFSSLTAAAADNGSKTLNLRATYKSTVTDNTQFSFTVTSATADPTGSTFAAGNAGGATSSTSGNDNRIEVTATKYNFSTQPPATTVVNTNFAAGVEALDANNNRDLDDATLVTLAASAGSLSSATGVAQNLSSGVYNWADLQNNTAGTGVSLSATGTHTTANSSTMTILSAEPTTQATGVGFSNILTTSMDVTWTSGNGNNRIVIAKLGSAPTFTPSDGSTYSFDNDFTLAPTQGDAKVVYKGSSNTFPLSGLTQNTTYYVAVFEYNNPPGTENFLLTSPATNYQQTAALVSTSSDIVAAGNETADLDYASKQSSTITSTSDGILVWSFTIRDGGGSADADPYGTEMTSVTIDQGGSNGISNWSNVIRQATLFDGSTKIADASTIGSTSLAFTGLSGSNVTAADGGSKTLDLYLSFKTTVIDNEQFQFQITNGNVTEAVSSSSLFTTFSAQTSSVSGDADRIEVTATKLNFSTQPPATTVVNTNFSAGVEALDANNNRDLDDATSVSLAASAGSLSSATGIPQNLSSGVYNWTDLQNNTAGTGVTLQATGGSLTLANSSAMTIYSAEPTSQASISGFSSVAKNSMTVDLSAGNGSYRIVLAKSGSAVNDIPVDGTTYSPNSTFGSGDQIGTGNYVIFAGSGTSAPVSGLTAGTTYHFAVFEFNGSGGTENYKTPGGTGSQMTAGETYTWNQTGSASWIVSTNWTPTRTTPATNDILQFNSSGTVTVTNVPAQTIGQLLVSNSDTVYLQAGAANTLTISGGTGTDLQLDAGSQLNINGASALIISLSTGATASISGSMRFSTAINKLTGTDASSIIFASGSSITQAAGNTSNIFGTTALNSVIFQSGSAFYFYTGSNPFGASAPNSVVIFQPGSTYYHRSSNTPSFSGRKFANYTQQYNGNITNSFSRPVEFYSVQIDSGSLKLWNTGTTDSTIKIYGDLINNSPTGGDLLFRAGTTNPIQFLSGGTQTISGTSSGTIRLNSNITVPGGTTLVLSRSINDSSGTMTVSGTLDCGTSVISGGGGVTVSSSGVVKTAHTNSGGALEGSIAASGGLTLNSGSTTELNGTSAQYLASRIFSNLTINNSTGVSLVGSITMNDVLLLSSGDLTTGGYTVDLGSTGTLSETAGNTVIGNVTVTRTVASPQDFGGIGFEMNSNGTSPGSTIVTRVTGVGQGPAAQSVKRYFDITPTNNSGLDVDATFRYDESELNGLNESTLEMWKSTNAGGIWTDQGGTANATNNYVTLNNVSSFSRWTLTDADNPLIVTGSELSDIVAGVLTIPTTISSLVDTQPEQVEVFDFTVRDGGAAGDPDLTGTILNYIQVVKGSSNTVSDWSATIQGAELFNGVSSLGTATIGADKLSWTGSPIVTVPDDDDLTLTVKIYLKTSMPAGSDGKVFEFQINQNTDVTVGGGGSYMAPGGSNVVGSPGTTIDVQATKLAFTTNPQSGLLVGVNIAPVAVTAQDANGNKDGGYGGSVTLSSGTFTLASTDVGGLTQTASAGVASWTNLTSSTSGTGTVLADASLMTQGVSNSISVLPAAVTSITTGSWSSGTTWNTGVKPTPTQSAIIATGHTVTMTASDTCEALTVQTGGVLDLVTFALQLHGTFTLQAGAEAKVSNYNPLPGNGTTPYNFASTSTFTFYGSVTGFSYRNPSVQTVTFGHVNWNSTGNATPAVGTIIAGNLIKRGSGELRCGTGSLPTGLSRTIVVLGNVNIKAGVLISNNATTPITGAMDIGGDLTIDSVGNVRGVNWTGDGTIRVGGNFVNSGSGQIMNIKPATPGATGNFTIYFKGTNTSTFTPGPNDSCRTFIVPIGKTVNVTTNGFDVQRSIEDSGALYLGTNVVKGVGNFILADGATLGIGSPDGITTSGATGNVQVTGTRTYSSLANYVYNGTVAQVTGNGFPANCNNLTINNPAGVTLSSNHAVNGVLTLTNGNVITGGIDKLTISSTGSISRTSGHIFGNLEMYIPTGTDVTRTFEIGGASNYTPIDLKFASVSVAGNLTGSTNVPDHPQIGTSGIDATKSVNRYYSLISGGVTFTTYDAVFTFVTDDVDPGANTSNFIVKKYDDPSWHSVTTGIRTLTSTQALGVTSVCDFAIGEPTTFMLTVNPGTGGTIVAPSSSPISVTIGSPTTITASPSTGYHFVNWTNPVGTASITDANAISTTVTLNVGDATVQANFALLTYNLTVTATTGGTITVPSPSPTTVGHGIATTITASATSGYIFTGWTVPVGIAAIANSSVLSTTATLTSGDATVQANFIEDPASLVMYRSFMPESLALDRDNKGKLNKYVLRIPNNLLKYPMPNRVNVLFETFLYSGYGLKGMVVGKDRSIDSGRYYAWFQTNSYKYVLRSLITQRQQMHSRPAHGFDVFVGGGTMRYKKSLLPPTMYDNVMFADMIALKLGITASAMGKIPRGFGELLYDDGTGISNPLNGKMIKEIAAVADSDMMGKYNPSIRKRDFAAPAVFANLAQVIENINKAFEGVVDTFAFAESLYLKGVRELKNVAYLKPNPSAIPAVIIPVENTVSQEPLTYALYQNYPNPFNPTTTIQFDLPEEAIVTLKIYNMLGQEMSTILDREDMIEGTQEVQFDAQNLSSGVYFYRIITESIDEDGAKLNSFQTVKKMILLR